MSDLSAKETKVYETLDRTKMTDYGIVKATGLDKVTVVACLTRLMGMKLITHTVVDMNVYYYQARKLPKPEDRKQDESVKSPVVVKKAISEKPSQPDKILEVLKVAGIKGLSYKELSEQTGIKQPSVQACISTLLSRGIVVKAKQYSTVIVFLAEHKEHAIDLGGESAKQKNNTKAPINQAQADTSFEAKEVTEPEPNMRPQTAKVYDLPASVNFTPEQALYSALDLVRQGRISEIMVIGYCDNDLVVRSSKMTRRDALWLLKSAELHTLEPLMVASDA